MTAEQVFARLRAAGHRLTAQRRQLVGILLQADAPLTADDIHRRARQARRGTDLSTIYRNLGTFCELGWLDVVPGGDGERYYQVHREQERAMSVVCLDCGQFTSLQTPPSEPLNAAVRGLGFNADTLRVTLSAHCERECQHKAELE